MDSAFLKQHAYSIAAMRKIAQHRLPRAVFDFVDGGAEDEIVVGRNESAFDELSLLPQPMRGTTRRDQTVELFAKLLNDLVIQNTCLRDAHMRDIVNDLDFKQPFGLSSHEKNSELGTYPQV